MANQQIPDVSVRLSAEGVSDVVRAFQQVSAAAKSSGKDSAKGLGVLNDALEGLKGLIPAITVAGVVAGLGDMVKSALDSAEAIGTLSQKTGLTTEVLSTLSFAATETGTDFDEVSKKLVRFNKTQGDLGDGSAVAAKAVKDLFGSANALNGLNTDQRFEKVATAIGKLPAGFQKTSAAMSFFGKSGADIIPLLDEIATKGFPAVEAEAEKFGLVVSESTAEAAKNAVTSFRILKLEAQGAALQFTEGLAPAVTAAMTSVSDALASGNQNGLEKFGEGAGTVVKAITLAFVSVGSLLGGLAAIVSEAFGDLVDVVKTDFQEIVVGAKAAGSAAKDALSGNVVGAAAELFAGNEKVNALNAAQVARSKQASDRAKAEFQATIDGIKATYNALFNSPSSALGGAGGNGSGTGNGTQGQGPEATKAILALQQQQLAAELALNNQYAALQADQEKQAYAQGLISLKQYFDDRTAAIDAASDEQIDALNKQRAALVAAPLDVASDATADQVQAKKIERRKEIAAIDNQLAAAQAQRLTQQSQNDDQRAQAELALADKQLQVQDQIKTAEGDTYGAALDSIDAQAAALLRLHLPAPLVEQWREMQVQAAAFAETVKEGQQAIGGLDVVQAQLQNRVDAGQLFPFQAVQQYSAAVNAALPNLRALAAAQLAAAVTPDQVTSAEQFADQVDHLAISADTAALRLGEFKKSVEESLTSNLTDYFTTGIDDAKNFGDAIRLMAVSVVDSLRQIASQMLATLIAQEALSAASGLFGSSLPTLAALPAVAVTPGGFASGGFVSGPGSGTSDSIAARLSAGEFVVRASAVGQPGVLPLLAAINRGMHTPTIRGLGVPRFATGGLVDGMSSGSPADTPRAEVTVGLEDGLVAKHMRSTDARRAMLTQVANNPKAFRLALQVSKS